MSMIMFAWLLVPRAEDPPSVQLDAQRFQELIVLFVIAADDRGELLLRDNTLSPRQVRIR